jgi:hypothetical protein
MPRRSRSRGRGRRSRSYRGGAANPSSYSDGQSYMLATVGGTNQQYDNVFRQGGMNNSQSNAIMDQVTGQRAGGRRRRSNKRGGSFVTDAIVPAAFLAGTYLYSRRRGNKGSSRKRSFRRRR